MEQHENIHPTCFICKNPDREYFTKFANIYPGGVPLFPHYSICNPCEERLKPKIAAYIPIYNELIKIAMEQ